jgi:lipopolysaccharide heptosyltransferase I
VRLSALGDVIHALPVLSGLKALLPRAEVDWVVEDRAAGLLEGRPDLRRVVVFPRAALRAARGLRARLGRAAAFVRELRDGRYDVAIDLQGNLKSGVVTRLSGARLRFGLDRRACREGNHLFTARRALPPRRARHRVERNLALLSALLGRDVPYVPPGFPSAPADRETAARLLSGAGLPASGFAVLHAGTSGFGAFKRWPAARFGDLARRLEGAGVPVAATCSPAERPLAEEVARASGGAARVVETPTLPVLAEVLGRSRLVVAADTGPLHLAALLEVPVVGLFGPKDPEVYGPYGATAEGAGLLPYLVRPDVACRPCGLRACADPVCMGGLEPAEVFSTATRLLATA